MSTKKYGTKELEKEIGGITAYVIFIRIEKNETAL